MVALAFLFIRKRVLFLIAMMIYLAHQLISKIILERLN